MDFIEQWFGISPDGGDGSLEALYVAAAAAIVIAIVARRRIRRYLNRSRSPRKLSAE